ncbi:MAG: hypothetical protein HYY76_09945 [Acidobacteria bacterium]|nr:hypothetical protein [Acidobacteriota bacterium]
MVSFLLPLLYLATASQSGFVLYLSVFAPTRIATEFWKLSVRVEPQEEFRIDTEILWISTLFTICRCGWRSESGSSAVGMLVPEWWLRAVRESARTALRGHRRGDGRQL